jgi:tetratricopeptide (TPR) repeat protein
MRSILFRFLPCFLLLTTLALSCIGPSRSQDSAVYENPTAPAIVQPAVNAGDNTTTVNPVTASLAAEEYDRAIVEAGAALEGNAENVTLKQRLADAYIARAWYYKVKRLNPNTLADLSKAVEIAPDYYKAHYELGRFHDNQWQFSIGQLDLDKALSLKPDFAPAYNERSYSYYKRQKYEKALADVSKAVELDASEGQFYYMRSLVYRGMGSKDPAIGDLQEVLRLSNDPSLRSKAEADLKTLQK